MIEFNIDLVQVLSIVSGVILPLIVGLVTTRMTSPAIKAVILAALSIVINIVAEVGNAISTNTGYDLGAALLAGLGTFLVAVGIHYGFWKPTTISQKAQDAFVVDRSNVPTVK